MARMGWSRAPPPAPHLGVSPTLGGQPHLQALQDAVSTAVDDHEGSVFTPGYDEAIVGCQSQHCTAVGFVGSHRGLGGCYGVMGGVGGERRDPQAPPAPYVWGRTHPAGRTQPLFYHRFL